MNDPSALRKLHQDCYHAVPEIYAAPGRVNLIGEHTDYAEGFVMPAAIDFATLAAISPRSDGQVVLRSENFAEQVTHPADALPQARRSKCDRPDAAIHRGKPSMKVSHE